jgi:hypothetical protein
MAALVTAFLHTSRLLSEKIKAGLREWPVVDVSDLSIVVLLESYHSLLNKHIDLVERRLLKGEKISERDQDRFLEF